MKSSSSRYLLVGARVEEFSGPDIFGLDPLDHPLHVDWDAAILEIKVADELRSQVFLTRMATGDRTEMDHHGHGEAGGE